MKDLLTILTGDCRQTLRTLGDESVHCVVTSPPYYGLRDYGTGEWQGGDPACKHIVGELRRGLGLASSAASTRGGGHKAAEVGNIHAQGTCPHCGAIRVDQQIGQEATPELYIETMVEVFREVRRVLRKDGTLWLNMGDSMANDTKWGGKTSGKHAKGLHTDGSIGRCRHLTGLAGKNIMGIPWRVAFALQSDGWILRQDIIWHKPNPMPESVTDRCTKAHEYIFLFSKSARYFYDAEAIKEPVTGTAAPRMSKAALEEIRSNRARGMSPINSNPNNHGLNPKARVPQFQVSSTSTFKLSACLPVEDRNKRSVWTVASHAYKEAHFATFPPDLIKPCILAGCPTRGTHCDCNEIIGTPLAEGEREDDPSMLTGRAGMNRPRSEGEGIRAITRREQRGEARQMKRSPHRAAMADICGQAFDHYIRTDRIGARPLPEHTRQDFIARGWLEPVAPCDCPDLPAGTVLDPFGGSGTTGMVALELGRRAVLCELNPEYRQMIDRRCLTTPGFDFSFDPQIEQKPLFPNGHV